MKNIKELCSVLGVDAVHGIDFETYYDNDYSLKKMSTTDYIYDPRFEMQLIAIKSYVRGKLQNTKVLVGLAEFKKWLKTINPATSAMLAHHTHFDGLIAYVHGGAKFKAYVDTMAFANATMSIKIPRSLVGLCAAFGRTAKTFGQALVDVKGVRLKDMTNKQLSDFKRYAGDDIDDTWFILEKMLPYVPGPQSQWADIVIRMYTNPVILLNEQKLSQLHSDELARKQALLDNLGMDKKTLMSNDKFADALIAVGVEPPRKTNAKGDITYAFSKTDVEFKELLEHENDDVRTLVEARFDVKSTSVETRALRLLNRVPYGPQPVYMKPFGAKTQRLAGGDKVNWQNMKRGSALRTAITAPKGYTFIIADEAQIEARLNAYCSGQWDIVEAFANDEDVYAIAAEGVYGRKINKVDDPLERFVGKVSVLSLGYGAGPPKFQNMLKLGLFGPPVVIDDETAAKIVKAWRKKNNAIANNWRATINNMRIGFTSVPVSHNVMSYQGVKSGDTLNGYAVLPSGLAIRYDDIHYDGNDMSYLSEYRVLRDGGVRDKRTRLYGGLAVENQMQALAAIIVADSALAIQRAHSKSRLVLQVHDELVIAVPKREAKRIAHDVHDLMTQPPPWAKDIPLACEVHISDIYDK